ncbi:hypothetical protein [Ramlibacter alkalitolerans]|jgi:hypothetical protein|uniref:DUF1732 domain-containing protein n=1 Tax=Ramlibacter alkalitolerans TaxID=2039631 RepID=A0ABS1JRL4_9BURK|nr:hypothetical protein [Ramlibacter alkalitolerans]MBL0426481.1 hypothetical protein [Ramlibacter alkalitolerans]
MYEGAHSHAAGEHALREGLARLEATLARCQQQVAEARRLHGAPGAEAMVRTATLLTEEIDRLRAQLA